MRLRSAALFAAATVVVPAAPAIAALPNLLDLPYACTVPEVSSNSCQEVTRFTFASETDGTVTIRERRSVDLAALGDGRSGVQVFATVTVAPFTVIDDVVCTDFAAAELTVEAEGEVPDADIAGFTARYRAGLDERGERCVRYEEAGGQWFRQRLEAGQPAANARPPMSFHSEGNQRWLLLRPILF